MKVLLDKSVISGSVLKREIILLEKGLRIKVTVGRNCSNYNANIKVSLINIKNIKELNILTYESEELVNKNLSYMDLDKAVMLNNQDLERVYSDIQKVLI